MTTAAPEMTNRLMAPRVNIIEREEAIVLEAELPGVPKDGVHLEFKDGELVLTGKRKPANGEGRVHVQERSRADFRRVFALSRSIDTQKIEANMKDGVLTVTLHKVDALKPRRISVN